jgi:hypothetical protein
MECNFPVSGYALILGTAQVSFWNTATAQQIQFAIADSTGVAPRVYRRDYGGEDCTCAQIINDPLTIHEFIPVSAGRNRFQFLAVRISASAIMDVTEARMTVLFVPTSYGGVAGSISATDVTMAKSGATATRHASAPVGETRVDTRPESDQVSVLRAEFAAELRALKEEIAALKGNR